MSHDGWLHWLPLHLLQAHENKGMQVRQRQDASKGDQTSQLTSSCEDMSGVCQTRGRKV